MQIVHASDRFVVERYDHVALAQARGSGWATVFNTNHDHASFPRQRIEAHHAAVDGNGLRGDADVTAADSSIAQQAAGDKFCRVDSDCETDSLGWQNRRCIDADDVTTRVDQWAARISRI